MSSAILYLAIVAIWAVVLVPRWLHPRSAQPEPAEPVPEDAEPVQEAVEPVPRAGEPVSRAADGDRADPARGGDPELTERLDEPAPAFPSSAERRASILQARRRMLTALVVLTAGAVGLAVTGIAASWVIVPPVMLLAGFFVLLREAARCDAERARHALRNRRAATAAVAGQEPVSFRDDVAARPSQELAGPAPAAAVATDAEPPPDAEVIDISARVSDQVYDQYSDAAERAVGD